MPDSIKDRVTRFLRWTEKYTKTDMVYAASGGFWMMFGQGMYTVLAIVLAILFARLVDKTSYGTFQYITAIVALLGVLTLSGLETALSQSVARGFERIVRDAFWIKVRWSLGSSAGAALIGAYYLFMGNETLGLGLIAAAFFMPFMYFGSTTGAFLTGRKNFKAATRYSAIQSTLYTILMSITILFLRQPLEITLAYFVISAAVATGLYVLALREFKPNDAEYAATNRFSKHMSLINVLNSVANQVDSLVVFHFLGPVELAIYSFANAGPQQLTGVAKILYNLALPKFANMPIEDARRIILKRTWVLVLGSTFVTIAYALAAPYLFEFLFPAYLQSVPYTQVLSLDFTLTCGYVLIGGLQDAHALIRQKYIINIVGNMSRIVFIIAGGAIWGIWGVVWGTLLGLVVVNVVNLVVLYRLD